MSTPRRDVTALLRAIVALLEAAPAEERVRLMRALVAGLEGGEPIAVQRKTAARLLDVPKPTIDEAARRGELPTVRFGKYDLIPLAFLRERFGGACHPAYTDGITPADDRRGATAAPAPTRAHSSGVGGGAGHHVECSRPPGAR